MEVPFDRMRLLHKGKPVTNIDSLHDGDSLLCIITPRLPSSTTQHVTTAHAFSSSSCHLNNISDDEDEDDGPLVLRLPANAPAWKHSLVTWLRTTAHCPELLLVLFFSPSRGFWLGLVSWMIGSKVASYYYIGGPYIVMTVLLLMFMNLGNRKEGTLSAYSWFNTGGRRLPGDLTADHLDHQLRRGHM
jgi:hypothetical protein